MNLPPVPADLDLRDFQYMPLDVVRLVDSDLTAIASGDEFKAAVTLWCKAWHQVPAASLPDDDRMLAHLSGYGRDVKGWMKVRAVALRGFELAEDGRLYHPVIVEKAIEAAEAKRRRREQTEAATKARLERKEQRNGADATPSNEQRNVGCDDQRNETRNVDQGKGREGKGNIDDGIGDARDPIPDLETKLREAAGWQNEPAPNLAVTGQIEALIANGCDLDLDVLPIIRAFAPRVRSRTNWKYFIGPIQQSRDDRIAASSPVNTEIPNVSRRMNGNGSHQTTAGRNPKPSAAQEMRDALADLDGSGTITGF